VAKIKTSPAILNDPKAHIDGRARRALDTRQRLVDAMAGLVLEGVFPTGEMVAGRAGVTTRAMFLHFDDMASLFGEVYARMTAKVVTRRVSVPAGASFNERLRLFVVMRGQFAEHFSHFSRTAVVIFHDSPRIQALVDANRRTIRDAVGEFFGLEMASLAPDVALTFADTLMAVTTWESWVILRKAFGHSVETSEAAFERVVRGLLTVTLPPDVALPDDLRPQGKAATTQQLL
jgi:TetR/AcrR family transcriptional regulator, regulator of autoinduction and epiphytic fitness